MSARPVERSILYELIDEERERQDKKWGGPAHDDQHDAWDWARFLKQHAAQVPQRPKEQLIRVAALAIAALESLDRTDGL